MPARRWMMILQETLRLQQQRRLGALLGTLVPTYLYGALEMHLHRVGELERLEMGVGEDRRGRAKVLDLGEPRHELRPGDATPLIDQLNRGPFTVVRHAISHEHVKLGIVVLYGEHHRHRLADFHQSGDLGRPGALADLYLHPAANVVAGEVGAHHVQHVDGERAERDRLLVQIVPSAPQLSRLIPNFLNLRVILHDDNVLEVRP